MYKDNSQLRMLGSEAVRAQAEALAYETLHAEIDKRIAKVLGRA